MGEAPRKFFKTTLFTLAINVTDTHFGRTVELEKRRRFGEFYVLRKLLSYFVVDELYNQNLRRIEC